MKVKIIRGFLAVYLALSLAYGGIRAAYLTVMAAMNPPEMAQEQIELAEAAPLRIDTVPAEPKDASDVIPPPAAETSDISEDISAASSPTESAAEDRAYVSEDPGSSEEYTSPENSLLEDQPSEGQAPESAEASEDEQVQPETLLEAPVNDETDEAYIAAAPAQDAPTLEDYLSVLHCGRCGRNCSLSNPRCRTGRSKAESATAEYYAEYGEI